MKAIITALVATATLAAIAAPSIASARPWHHHHHMHCTMHHHHRICR